MNPDGLAGKQSQALHSQVGRGKRGFCDLSSSEVLLAVVRPPMEVIQQVPVMVRVEVTLQLVGVQSHQVGV